MEVTAYLYEAVHDRLNNVVRGFVFGDKKKRFSDGDLIRSSFICAIKGDFVTTLNSSYRVISWEAR
jgi:hypothetical protein